MTLGPLCLGLYLVFTGLELLGAFVVSNKFLGILALIAGLVFLLDSYHPVTIWRRP